MLVTSIMKNQRQTPKRSRVLLVDDDDDDRIIFREALTELKMEIDLDIAKHGEDALNYLENAGDLPDILFLDLNMPIMNGIDCLRHIRQNNAYKNVLVIIYSTSENEEEVEQMLVLGANAYIKKPSSFEGMKKMLYKHLSKEDKTLSGRSQAAA